MTGRSTGRVGHVLKQMCFVAAISPLAACSSIPMPQFVDDAFPGMFKTAPKEDPMMMALRQHEEIETIVADINQTTLAQQEVMVAKATDTKQPDVFQASDMAMWDGRPTLGDIWVSVPGALQPERVVIRNDATGAEIKGAMFVRDERPQTGAPIRLSPGAAKALGVAPLELAKITVTAIRKGPRIDQQVPVIARSDAGASVPRAAAPKLSSDLLRFAPQVSFADPYLTPSDNLDGYVEVAQAIDPGGASRVREQLFAAAIPAEIQEDFVDGRSVYRVFASAKVDHDSLGGTLHSIRLTGAEGSDDGTLIAEMPEFGAQDPLSINADMWMAVGTYGSRNEAMAMVQKMARRAIPAQVCPAKSGEQELYRVFGGPAHETGMTFAQKLDTSSFCIGLATGEALAPNISKARNARAADPAPATRAPYPIPEGAVRIRVGESTGGLNLRVPNPYSAPVQIPVAGVMLSLPMHVDPEFVAQVRTLLEPLNREAALVVEPALR